MKKVTWLVVLALMVSMIAMPAMAEGTYAQAPMFDEKVESGELAPVEERLPEEPKLAHEILDEYLDMEIGNYGGTLRLTTSVVNWDADGFIGMNEGLMSMSSTNSGEIIPNVLGGCEVNDDMTEFTFTLRKGLKWSDGTEVTMDDVKFGIENFVFNEELTPSISSYMRDGGLSTGDPFTFEVIDDNTFKLTFKLTYGGFLVHISANGWKGYTDILKPAHYLKPFHKDFAEECHGSLDAYWEFMQPFATAIGYDDVKEADNWTYVFNQIDMTNWELTDPTDALTNVTFKGLIETNFPHLYPWIMESNDNGVTTWVRNPYYFKVDANGNQLPYFDYVVSTLVEDMEMVQMKYMAGEADFARESATIDNISLYRENEEKSHMKAYTTSSHVNSCSFNVNLNYGMNTDGTVKDDDLSKAWQECVSDTRFLKALELCIDAQEILDSVYNGFGVINDKYECTGDFDAANALLDEMGMVDVDGDGWRETPSGLPFSFMIWNSAEASDFTPNSEFWVEYTSQIGLKFGVNPSDQQNLRNAWAANDVPCSVFWCESAGLWYSNDWNYGVWAPLWGNWYSKGGLSGEESEYAVPSDTAIKFFENVDKLLQVDPAVAATEIFDEQGTLVAEMGGNILPMASIDQCVLVNEDIGNVPTGGIGIGWNYSIEQMFYNNPDQH